LINQFEIAPLIKEKKRIINQITNSYYQAQFFQEIMPIITDVIYQNEQNLAKFIHYSLVKISEYLNIGSNIVVSSEIDKDNSLMGQARVIDICNNVGATEYVNLPGGISLYNKEDFKNAGISLLFLHPTEIKYNQSNETFVPNLSIIDVMMFNSVKTVQKMLNQYSLK
jgi:hypothetical protein